MPDTTTSRLALAVGGTNDKPCGICGNPFDATTPRLVAIKDDTTGSRVCETCARMNGPAGMWEFVKGLDQIHAALGLADPQYRPVMVALALNDICFNAEVAQRNDPPGGPQAIHADEWRENYADAIDAIAHESDLPAHEVAAQPWPDLAEQLAERQEVIDMFNRAVGRGQGDAA